MCFITVSRAGGPGETQDKVRRLLVQAASACGLAVGREVEG